MSRFKYYAIIFLVPFLICAAPGLLVLALAAGTEAVSSVAKRPAPSNIGEAGPGSFGSYLPDDENSVLHCKAEDFDGTTLRCGKTAVRHRGVGPYTSANNLSMAAGAGAAAVGPAGVFSACVVFSRTSAAANDLLFSAGAFGASGSGYALRITSAGGASVQTYGAGSTANQTNALGTEVLNAENIVCGGRDGLGNQLVKLNTNATVTAAALNVVNASTVNIGYNASLATALAGTVAEVWVSSTAASDASFTTIINTALAATGPGAVLPGLAGDSNTVLHCVGDDYKGGSWNCNPDRTAHTGVGTFKDTEYLNLTPASDPLDFAGDFTQCINVSGGAIGNTIYSNGAASVAGVYVQVLADSTIRANFGRAGGATALITTAAFKTYAQNAICWGRSGTDVYLKLNGLTTITGSVAAGFVSGTSHTAYLGRYNAVGSAHNGSNNLTEVYATSTAWNESTVAALQTAALAGSNFTADGNAVLHTVFDDWTGASIKSRIGPNWSVTGSLGSTRDRLALPATTLSLTGDVRWSDYPYNWPALAWTTNGTVPKTTISQSAPRGFGAEHRGSGPFSDANYWSLGAGSDVLDFASDYTMCVIFNPTSVAAQSFFYDNSANPAGTGHYTTLQAGGAVSYAAQSHGIVTTTNVAVLGTTNVACGGRDLGALLMRARLNNGVVAEAAASAGGGSTSAVAYLGRYSTSTGYAYNGTISEVYFTTTKASSALITALTNQALSCAKPGSCFEPDANAVMHCNMDTDLQGTGASAALRCKINKGNDQWTRNGSITSTTPARYVWPAGSSGLDREGMGSFSDTNYFSRAANGDLSGNVWTGCLAYHLTTTGGSALRMYSSRSANSGFDIEHNSGACRLVYGNTGGVITTSESVGAVGPNLCCVGSDGTTLYASLNGSAANTDARGSVATASNAAMIGRYTDSTGSSFSAGTVNELWFSTSTPSDAVFQTIYKQFQAKQTINGAPITVTNTAPASCTQESRIYYVPENQLCVAPASAEGTGAAVGRRIQASYVNLDKQSQTLDSATWVKQGNVKVTSDQAVAPDQTTTMDLVQSSLGDAGIDPATGAVEGLAYQVANTVTRSVGPFIHEVYVKATADGGLGYNLASVGVACGSSHVPGAKTDAGADSGLPPDAGANDATQDSPILAANCTCATSDGSACSARVDASGKVCVASTTTTLTTKRLWVTGTCGGHVTQILPVLHGGGYPYVDAGTVPVPGQALIWGTQLETGGIAHAYSGVTTSSTRSINADVATQLNPLYTGTTWTNTVRASGIPGDGATGGWACNYGTCTQNTGDTTAPDGTNTAMRFTQDSNTQHHGIYATITGSPTTMGGFVKYRGQGSAWVAYTDASSGTSATYFNVQTCTTGSTVGADFTASKTIPSVDGWCWITALNGGGALWSLRSVPSDGANPSFAGDSTSGYYLWGPQGVGSATTYYDSYCGPTGTGVGGTKTCSSGVSNTWCVRVKATPINGIGWAPSVAAAGTLWELGTHNAANSSYVLVTSSAIFFDVFDGAGGQLRRSVANTLTGTPTIIACNDAGSLGLYVNGALVGAQSLTGTGLWSATPTTTYVGGQSGGTSQCECSLEGPEFCSYGTPTACNW